MNRTMTARASIAIVMGAIVSACGGSGLDGEDRDATPDESIATAQLALENYSTDKAIAEAYRPHVSFHANHNCWPLSFKEISNGETSLSGHSDYCNSAYDANFVVSASVSKDSSRPNTYRITYGIAFGQQESHLSWAEEVAGWVGEELDLGTHGQDAQYIVVDVVDGEVTSVWADLHKGSYVRPADWLTMSGHHVTVYPGRWYNSLKLEPEEKSVCDVACSRSYDGDIPCTSGWWIFKVTSCDILDSADEFMNYGDRVGTSNVSQGKLVMVSDVCSATTSYTSPDNITYTGNDLASLVGYVGCSGTSTANVWTDGDGGYSYFMKKTAYTGPYALKGCDSGDINGGDICNGAAFGANDVWTTYSGTDLYLEPTMGGEPLWTHETGTPFNDILSVSTSTRPSSLTYRTGTRVDALSITYGNGTVKSHGGSGGSSSTISDLLIDPITSVRLCNGNGSGNDDFYVRTGSIEFKTLRGRTFSGGAGTDDCQTIAPSTSTKQLFGFYGRASSEMDSVGTYWGTVVTDSPTITWYEDSGYSGTSSTSTYSNNTCVNVPSSMNDKASSMKFYGMVGSATTAIWYKDSNCSGTSGYVTAAATAMGYAADSGVLDMQDAVTSYRLVWGDAVTASNVGVSFSANTVTGSYTYSSSKSLTESGTTYKMQRADNSSGSNSSTINTSTSWTLVPSDTNKYFRFCVVPKSPNATGSETCSSWTNVGHLISLYKDSNLNQSGSSIALAYRKYSSGTCFTMSNYSFNDEVSSYSFYNPTSSTMTITHYRDSNCSGTSTTRSVAPTSTDTVSSMYSTFGSSWNDSLSSFKITW